jgi:predicted nucleic acid-binding protein
LNLYAESSAVLAWLLGEPRAAEVREILASSELVISSDLTLVECDRVLIRATVLGELPEAEAASRRAELGAAASHWTLLRPAGEIIDRARQRFPDEPVRTLDALHLSSALMAKAVVPDVGVLSLDEAIRTNARRLGFAVFPAESSPVPQL